MNRLTNKMLLETFMKAVENNLSEDFIELIRHEIMKRKFTATELKMIARPIFMSILVKC